MQSDTKETMLEALSFRDSMLGFAFGLLRDWRAAEEVVNDSLIAVYHNHWQFSDSSESFFVLMKDLVTEKCEYFLDNVHRREAETINPRLLGYLSEVIDSKWDDTVTQQVAEERLLLEECMGKLSEENQELLFDFYAKGYSYKELSDVRRSQEMLVKNNLLFVRRRLRTCIDLKKAQNVRDKMGEFDKLFDALYHRALSEEEAEELIGFFESGNEDVHSALIAYIVEHSSIAIGTKQLLSYYHPTEHQRYADAVPEQEVPERKQPRGPLPPQQASKKGIQRKFLWGGLVVIFLVNVGFVIYLITRDSKSDSPTVTEYPDVIVEKRDTPAVEISETPVPKPLRPEFTDSHREEIEAVRDEIHKIQIADNLKDSTVVSQEKHVASEEPVYYFPFDGDALEKITGEHLEIPNDLNLVNGILGKAYEFIGDIQFINLPVKKLNLLEGSISVWFRINSHQDHSAYIFCHDLRYGEYPDENRLEIFLKERSLAIGMGDNHYVLKGVSTIEANVWYNVVLVWAEQECKVYLNGESMADGKYNNIVLKGKAYVGYTADGAGRFRRLDGVIDELKIWNRAIAADEVLREYQQVTKEAMAR